MKEKYLIHSAGIAASVSIFMCLHVVEISYLHCTGQQNSLSVRAVCRTVYLRLSAGR